MKKTDIKKTQVGVVLVAIIMIILGVIAYWGGRDSAQKVDDAIDSLIDEGVEPSQHLWDKYAEHTHTQSFGMALILTAIILIMIVLALPKMVTIEDNGKPEKIVEKNSQNQKNEAIRILNVRYAKGEITKEEFEQMKKDMKE